MSRLSNASACVLISSAALAFACTPEPFVGRVSLSRHFEYHDREAEPLCSTLLSTLDENADQIGPLVQLDPQAGSSIRYYKFRSLAELTDNGDCASGAGACAINGNAVLSPLALHLHELGHIYVQRGLNGPSSPLLEEGFAVALSCQPWLNIGSPLASLPGFGDFRSYLTLHGDNAPSGVFSSYAYLAAGMFVTYLIRKYGWERVRELYQAIPLGASGEDFERAFAQTLPTSADDAWHAALSEPNAPFCLTNWLCAAEPLEAGESDTSCLGQLRRTFDVNADQAGVVLSVTGDDTAVIDCHAHNAPLWLPEATAGRSDWLSLPPGHYALANLNQHPDRVRIDSTFSASLFSADCESATEVALSATEPTFVTLPAMNAALGFVRVGGAAQRFMIQSGLGISAQRVSLCESCTAGASCTQILPAPTLPTVALADGAVLRIENAVTRADFAFAFYPASGGP